MCVIACDSRSYSSPSLYLLTYALAWPGALRNHDAVSLAMPSKSPDRMQLAKAGQGNRDIRKCMLNTAADIPTMCGYCGYPNIGDLDNFIGFPKNSSSK